MALRFLHYADLEAAYNDPERIGRLVGLIKQLRDDETIISGAGDNTGPNVLSLVTRGKQALDYFNAVNPDVETFGNHDFDHGVDALLNVVDESPQTWLCANVFRNGTRFGTQQGVVPWTVVQAGPHRVGIIGVGHPETDDLNPEADEIRFTNPIRAVESGVDALRDEGVDRIAVVSHLGDDTELARTVDVDLVLGAHDHEIRSDYVDGTVVCRPGAIGRYLLEVSFGETPTVTHHEIEDVPIDETVVDAIRSRIEDAGLNDVIGTTSEPIFCDMMGCKRGESRIGNVIVDAYRWKTGADVAVNSGGGFRRRSPLEGEVTAFDLVSITPYDSELLVLEVDGNTVMQTFEQLALEAAPDDVPRWHFGHVSGASIRWDDAASELRNATVDGEPVERTETYEVTTTKFFVDNDQLFSALDWNDVVERDGPQYEAVVEYVRETGLDPEPMGRIRRPALESGAIPERNWPHSPG